MRSPFPWLIVCAVVAISCSREYRLERRVDDLKITLAPTRYPLSVGENVVLLAITDRGGSAVPNATVSVRYWLPPMPGMSAVEGVTEPTARRDGLSFVASTHTAARWNVEVSVYRPGKRDARAGFALDVR